ncbi:MAG: type II secretion system protein [bacterium]|nr:type II secretion system protein [bacterium]
MKRRGFTLVELLVVVSIIALLIAILLPSMQRARKQARTVVCQSNMRSLMQAIYVYANNHEDRLVTAGLAHGGSVDEHAAWINTLKGCYGNALVARCPSDKSIHFRIPVEGTTQLRRASYATNYYTVAKIGGRGPYNKLAMIKRPSSTILMTEIAEAGAFAACDHVHPESWWANPRTMASEEVQMERHLKRANYSFIDSHVEALTFEQTYLIDVEAGLPLKFLVNKYDPLIAR